MCVRVCLCLSFYFSQQFCTIQQTRVALYKSLFILCPSFSAGREISHRKLGSHWGSNWPFSESESMNDCCEFGAFRRTSCVFSLRILSRNWSFLEESHVWTPYTVQKNFIHEGTNIQINRFNVVDVNVPVFSLSVLQGICRPPVFIAVLFITILNSHQNGWF